MIDRSYWCLCDSGIAGRFMGFGCSGGGGLWRRGGRGSGGVQSFARGKSISLRRRDVKILTDFLSQFIGDFGVAWHR